MGQRLVRLTRSATAVTRARRWLTDEVAGSSVGRQAHEDLLVMASELVTNVLMHTSSTPVLSVTVDGDRVRVAVHDDDPHLPQLRERAPERVGGNGLLIVDAWAAEWGVEPHEGNGKTVWFTVPIVATASV